MPTGSDVCSMRETRPRERSSDAAAPALRLTTSPEYTSTSRRSRVDRLSSPARTISAVFTSFSALSAPKPASSSRSVSTAHIVPSTAARPPLPIPSLRIAVTRPFPSTNCSTASPHSAAPPQLCCAVPIRTRKRGGGHRRTQVRPSVRTVTGSSNVWRHTAPTSRKSCRPGVIAPLIHSCTASPPPVLRQSACTPCRPCP